MSHAHTKKSIGTRAMQALCLCLVFELAFVLRSAEHDPAQRGTTVAATGLLLLGGMLLSEIFELFALPHLTGYIAAGVISGPYVLHFISHDTVKELELFNTLALSLIALAGGLELRLSDLKSSLKSVGYSTAFQTVGVLLTQTALFAVLARFVPFTQALPLSMVLGVSVLWGVLAVSRSPSATLAILSQTRAKGPLSRFSLAFVMSSDVVVVVLMALTLAVVKPLLDPGTAVSLKNLVHVSHEIVGSASLGTTLGLCLILYMRLYGKHVIVVLVTIGFVFSEGLRYLHFDPLLTFLTAGFVVQNLSRQGEKLLHAIEGTGSVVFVVFFATAGAHIDVPLLAHLWPIAIGLCAGRFVATWVMHVMAAASAQDSPLLKRWGWASLISQAGLTLGLSTVLARNYPEVGEGLRSLVVATVAINEVVGPILFKLALDRTGEVDAREPS